MVEPRDDAPEPDKEQEVVMAAAAEAEETAREAEATAETSEADRPLDAEALQAEVERLRAENEALATQATPHHFWRNAIAGVSIVLGVVLLFSAISAVWLNRTVMDENRWVETMAPLAKDPAIQNYVATTASNALLKSVDIQSYVTQGLSKLPLQTQFLATPITNAIENFVRQQANAFVKSSQFPQLWEQMNRIAHKAFIASITQTQGGLVNNQSGKVTLDVGVLVDQIKAALTAKGLGFVNNIPIPVSNKEVTLVDSPALGQLASSIQLLNALAYVLPILAIAFLAAGVAVAVNRRKAVLWIGVGILAGTILPNQGIFLGAIPFANAANRLAQMPSAAAQDAYNIVFRYLIAANRLVAVVGLVFVVAAIVAGPSKWATALRDGLTHGIDNIGPDWDFGAPGEWIFAHRAGLRVAGAIVAVASLLVLRVRTVSGIVWIVVFYVIWLLLVQLFGRPRPARPAVDVEAAPDEAPGPTI